MPGPQGLGGPPGPGLDIDAAFIMSVAWKHGAQVTLDEAMSFFKALRCRLSRSVDPAIVERAPQIMQVLAEPSSGFAGNFEAAAMAVLSLRGSTTFTPQTVTWVPDRKAIDVFPALLSLGGRVTIRVHAGTIVDDRGEPFSAALDALLGIKTPHLPGGVFESWFFVAPQG